MKLHALGIDLGKTVFHLVGLDSIADQSRISLLATSSCPRLGDPLHWLDTADGHHGVSPPGLPSTQPSATLWLYYESTHRSVELAPFIMEEVAPRPLRPNLRRHAVQN